MLLRFCFKTSGNGSNGGNFAIDTVIVFMCYLLVSHKKNKERKASKEGQKGENYSGGMLKKRKEVLVPFQ